MTADEIKNWLDTFWKDKIDRISDTVRPDTVARPTIFINTETHSVSFWDGSVWVDVATQGWVNENADNYVLPSDVVQDNSYVKTDKNFTDNHFTKLNSMDATALNKVPDTYAPIGNVENNIVYVQNPKGGTLRKSGNSVGMIRIKTPSAAGNAMLTFTVDIFEYSTRKSRTMKISGYAYTGAWANTSVHTVTSATGIDPRVTFYTDSTKHESYVFIGLPTTKYSYLHVKIRDFSASHSSLSVDTWKSGWNVSLQTTTTGGLKLTNSNNLVASDWNKVANKPNLALYAKKEGDNAVYFQSKSPSLFQIIDVINPTHASRVMTYGTYNAYSDMKYAQLKGSVDNEFLVSNVLHYQVDTTNKRHFAVSCETLVNYTEETYATKNGMASRSFYCDDADTSTTLHETKAVNVKTLREYCKEFVSSPDKVYMPIQGTDEDNMITKTIGASAWLSVNAKNKVPTMDDVVKYVNSQSNGYSKLTKINVSAFRANTPYEIGVLGGYRYYLYRASDYYMYIHRSDKKEIQGTGYCTYYRDTNIGSGGAKRQAIEMGMWNGASQVFVGSLRSTSLYYGTAMLSIHYSEYGATGDGEMAHVSIVKNNSCKQIAVSFKV